MNTNANGQYRHWMITQHLTTDYQHNDTLDRFDSALGAPAVEILAQCSAVERIEAIPNLRFAQFQIERGDDLKAVTNVFGSLHMQAYVELAKPVRFASFKKMLPEGSMWRHAHVERRLHSRTAARDYCRKPDSLAQGCESLSFGEWREDAKRKVKKENAMATCGELIEKGWTYGRFALDRPDLFLRFGKRISECITARNSYSRMLASQEIEDEQTDEEE